MRSIHLGLARSFSRIACVARPSVRGPEQITNRLLYQLSYVGPGAALYHIRRRISLLLRGLPAGPAWASPDVSLVTLRTPECQFVPGSLAKGAVTDSIGGRCA